MIDLVYGQQSLSRFLDAGEAIAKEVTAGRTHRVIRELNKVFFGGGALAPKRFSQLLSIDFPSSPSFIDLGDCNKPNPRITITKSYSFSATLGYIEGIPVLGSALAIINSLYHLFGLLSSDLALKKAVKQLQGIERSEFNVGRGASCRYTSAVFDAAIDLTLHRNHLVGSLLSIIPLLKPVTRIVQATLYQLQTNRATF